MSKFFAQGNISDQEDGDNREENQNPIKNQPSYQYDFMDDKFSIEKRVVRTEKDKKWNLIKDFTIKLNNALNNQDFEKVWSLLQDLLKEIEKSSKIIEKEGHPSFFLHSLKRVNDEITQFNKNTEARKKMKKHSVQAFNAMNQKFKKIYPDYELLIKQLIDKGEEEEQQQEEQQDENQEEQSSSEEESENDDINLLQSEDPMVRRRYWLKSTKKRRESEQIVQEKPAKTSDDKKKQQKKKDVKIIQQKKKPTEIKSIKDAENRMKDIRKGFMKLHNQDDREQYLVTLNKISQTTKEAKDFEKLSFYLLDIPIRIDVCRQMKLTHFPRNEWLKLYQTINQVYHILRESEQDDLLQSIRLFDQNNKNDAIIPVTQIGVHLSLKTYLILIESQLKKALVFLDSNELQYFERLQDLIGVVDLMYKISKKIQITDGYQKEAAELSFKVLQNVYFMDARLIERIKNELQTNVQFLELANSNAIEQYANSVLKHISDDQVKTKTLLYLIYNHTINGREKGKQLLVVSTLSQSILHQDYYTQCLYNRALVQIGLLAFRQGNIFEVQQFLYEMCSVAKMKENTKDILRQFLAQGYSRLLGDKDLPKNKILPIYLHLNVDLIQSIQLIASMLLEIPYTLTEGGRITSKTLKRFYYQYERNYFIGESLNNRDLIYSASLQLREGNWQKCFQLLSQLNIWNHLNDSDTVKSNILRVVKQQALKCYLIGNRKCFKSIALKGLAAKYTLDEKAIRRHVCKLINQKILQGSITREGYLIFVQKKQTQIQKICESLFEKIKEISKANEDLFSQKIGTGQESDDEKDDKIMARKSNLAINEKLKAILSKRTEKY